MAGCNQTLSGLINDCAPSMGGIVEVYAASREDIESIVETDSVVSTITMGATAKFQKYSFKRNTGSMTSTLQVSQENGTRYVSTDLVLSFTRMETAKRIEKIGRAHV